jgi:predicted AAA+ superfamily ATPase
VGKTTLVKLLRQNQANDTLYLNADLPAVRENLTNTGLERIKSIIGTATFVVIDEAQRIKDIGITLKKGSK